MGNILSTDVSYSISKIKKLEDGRKIVNVTLAFGDGALTYPAGGIPLLIGKMGCPVDVDSLQQVGNAGVGYVFQYDKANKKLMMLSSTVTAAHTHSVPAHAHDLLLKNAVQADGATTRVNAAADKLGANTGGDLTVTGAGANGGVQNSAVGVSGSTGPSATSLSEPSGVAIVAQSVNFQAIGY